MAREFVRNMQSRGWHVPHKKSQLAMQTSLAGSTDAAGIIWPLPVAAEPVADTATKGASSAVKSPDAVRPKAEALAIEHAIAKSKELRIKCRTQLATDR